MQRNPQPKFIIAASIPLVFALACGEGTGIAPELDPQSQDARVLALSTYGASVGTLVEVYGSRFPSPSSASIQLVFEGTFERADGVTEPVSFTTNVRRADAGTLRWTGFGPYANPFSKSGGGVGRFVGTVGTRVTEKGGEVRTDSAPLSIAFDVKPSILVHEIQPVSASCAGNVLRALGGAAYRVRVEAIGFEPVSFTYTLSAPALSSPPISVRHLARGRFDELGTESDFRFPPVPNDLPSYSAILSIAAQDAEGRLHQSAFVMGVHRPLEVFYNGNIDVAEVLAPAPVSGCIPGGVNGREVTYNESQSESRSKSYGVSWNESWLSSHTVASGSQETIGLSEQNGVGFATTDGQTFRWSLGAEVGGSLGLDKLVSIGVKTNAEIGGETSRTIQQSGSRETGINASSTTTETEEASRSAGGQQGEDFAWVVESSEQISRTFGGHVIAGTFGVFYRQTVRLMRRAALVAYNQCGYADVVGDVDFIDWTWSPDLGMGNTCVPLPPSNLPPAQCYLPPCGGE